MPFMTPEEIYNMVMEDRKLASKNKKIDKYIHEWIHGRNYFDATRAPLKAYKNIAKRYNHILFNKEL